MLPNISFKDIKLRIWRCFASLRQREKRKQELIREVGEEIGSVFWGSQTEMKVKTERIREMIIHVRRKSKQSFWVSIGAVCWEAMYITKSILDHQYWWLLFYGPFLIVFLRMAFTTNEQLKQIERDATGFPSGVPITMKN